MRQKPFVIAIVVLAFHWTGCATAGEQRREGKEPCLRLDLVPPSMSSVPVGNLVLSYALRNTCRHDVVFCKPPGPACHPSWSDAKGVFHGVLSGWPDSHDCPRESFARMAPQEILPGFVSVEVFSTPSGDLSIRCVYQATGSGRFGDESLWVGSVNSNWVEIHVAENHE